MRELKNLPTFEEFINERYTQDEVSESYINEGMKGHHHNKDGNWYVDSDFINLTNGVLPKSELKHMGFGEFYLKTPDGDIQFNRMSGIKFKDQVGRSHQMYDDVDGKLVDALIKKMEDLNRSVLVESNASKLFPMVGGFAKKAAKKMKKGTEYSLNDISDILIHGGESYLGKINLINIGKELVTLGFNVKLEEMLTKFNRGSLVKHELHPEFNGTVEVGPDTYENIKNQGYEMPNPDEYQETINEPIWYGIVLTENGKKVGINYNEFIMD